LGDVLEAWQTWNPLPQQLNLPSAPQPPLVARPEPNRPQPRLDRDAGKEEFHRTGKPVMALRHNDPVLYFIQRMRDEVHRFAIGTHRAKRSKAIGATPLDDVPGVGATRKRALLAHFGSAKAVARANLADLKAVEGVSGNMAQAIYDYFHENG
ncbi:MAG: helix-hairpin-helix domain-containing protein, partial [Paracoccaceae bacterium]|nr:helix-hairpin-helix domain-containing protein [Paracoccaceae bacterium]